MPYVAITGPQYSEQGIYGPYETVREAEESFKGWPDVWIMELKTPEKTMEEIGREYLNSYKESHCPFCDNPDIEGSGYYYETINGEHYLCDELHCLNCEHSFDDLYKHVGVKLYRMKEDPNSRVTIDRDSAVTVFKG